AVVMALLFVAQFIDRGLALLIPLQVAHLPEIEKIAAVSGTIVSIGAIAATTSANVAARLAREIPAARILLIGLFLGGPLSAWLGDAARAAPVHRALPRRRDHLDVLARRHDRAGRAPRRGVRLAGPRASDRHRG